MSLKKMAEDKIGVSSSLLYDYLSKLRQGRTLGFGVLNIGINKWNF